MILLFSCVWVLSTFNCHWVLRVKLLLQNYLVTFILMPKILLMMTNLEHWKRIPWQGKYYFYHNITDFDVFQVRCDNFCVLCGTKWCCMNHLAEWIVYMFGVYFWPFKIISYINDLEKCLISFCTVNSSIARNLNWLILCEMKTSRC